MVYGYCRASTKHQNEGRQVDALLKYGIAEENIIIEKESGKLDGLERTQYSILRKLLRASDVLVIDAVDRLGRKKSDIKAEMQYLQSKQVRLVVLNIPTTTMEMQEGQEWLLDMVLNIIIEVYSTIAEQELVEKERRTRAGIELAKAAGKYTGRKPIQYDENKLKSIYPRWKAGQVKTCEYRELLGLKPNTFYRAIAHYEQGLTE